MPFLTLNGVTVPVASASPVSVDYVILGEDSRADSGAARKNERAEKREFMGQTAPILLSESNAYRGLINGRGHHFPLEVDLYADTGLGPASAVSIGSYAGPQAPWGNYLQFNAVPSLVTWDVGAGSEWTIVAAAQRPFTWGGLIRRSDGTSFQATSGTPSGQTSDPLTGTGFLSVLSGALRVTHPTSGTYLGRANSQVRALGKTTTNGGYIYETTTAGTTAAAPPTFNTGLGSTTVDGTSTWTNRGPDPLNVADLAFLPYFAPDAMAQALVVFELQVGLAPLPYLWAGGDMFNGVRTLVDGRVTGARSVEFLSGGVLTQGHVLEFRIREV